MSDVNKDQCGNVRQVFYDAFDDSSIMEFAREFACMVNGQTGNIYRIADGIHIGIRGNVAGVTEKEITDIFSSAARDFVIMRTNDDTLANYTRDNIASMIKILFIDTENFTIII